MKNLKKLISLLLVLALLPIAAFAEGEADTLGETTTIAPATAVSDGSTTDETTTDEAEQTYTADEALAAFVELLRGDEEVSRETFGSYSFSVGERRGDLQIVYRSEDGSGDYGAVNVESGELVAPFEYYFLYFLGEEALLGQSTGGVYRIDEDATVVTALEGSLHGIAADGTITMYKEVRLEPDIRTQQPGDMARVYMLALYDSNCEPITDFIIPAAPWPYDISFNEDGYAIVARDIRRIECDHRTSEIETYVGAIDREGNFVVEPKHSSLTYLGDGVFKETLNEIVYSYKGDVLYADVVEVGSYTVDVDDFDDRMSFWAVDEVEAAIEAGYVPNWLRHSYNEGITRGEFCALAVALYEQRFGEITERRVFTDNAMIAVEKAGAIGIVEGLGDDIFATDQRLSRQEAATILARLAVLLGLEVDETLERSTFADDANIAWWAVKETAQVQALGVMEGDQNNKFDPLGLYTTEQAIATIVRLAGLIGE